MHTTRLGSRRDFVGAAGTAAGAAWLSLQLPLLAVLASCARDDAHVAHLTAAEMRTLRAFAARVIPAVDGFPGADTADAAHFIDRALGTPAFARDLSIVRIGLGFLAARNFADLSDARQDALLRRIEHDPFFAIARTLVVVGTLADPSYGGNRDGAGWRLVGDDRRPSYAAPFGWYDAHELADAAAPWSAL